MATGTRSGSELLRAQMDSAATVTHFLEALTGESIVADVTRQAPAKARADNALGVAVGEVLVHRTAVLRGEVTGRPYLYAVSLFAPERLPAPVLARLQVTNDPIGRVLVDHGCRLAKKPLRPHDVPGIHGEDHVILDSASSRAYRLVVDDIPMFAIGEWLLPGVIDVFNTVNSRHPVRPRHG